MTSSADSRCPECAAVLPAGAPQALCPACLLRQALASRTAFEPSASESASSPPPPSPAEIADKFPQFEIMRCLGRGGMGVVYQARQKSLNRLVAIKILAPGRERDARFAERFAREAELLARLGHPHIVTIHDFGETGGLFYIVMEFVDGVNLRDLIRDGKLEANQALAIVPPICDALQYAHEKGVVHRDIKPENLLLDRDGRVKIADFGIASLVGSGGPGERAGTPPYMAPEQGGLAPDAARGAGPVSAVDHRADIYALGVVLYEMLTGERPASDVVAPSKKVQIDVRLDEIVLRALEKVPSLRYQTAGEFRTCVETMTAPPPLASQPSTAAPAPSLAPSNTSRPPAATTRSRLRRPIVVIAIGAAAACAFTVLVMRDRRSPKSPTSPPPAPTLVAKIAARPVSGPPFLAKYPGGTAELIMLTPVPRRKGPSWSPDGGPGPGPFPAAPAPDPAPEGRELRLLLLRVQGGDRFGSIELRILGGDAARFHSRSYLRDDPAYTDAVLELLITPETRSFDFEAGVASGDWETVFTLKPAAANDLVYRKGVERRYANRSEQDGRETWMANVDCLVGTPGDTTVSFQFSRNIGWDSRLALLMADGSTKSFQGGVTMLADITTGLMVIPQDVMTNIRGFHLQRRPFHWVEFRNVSLQPGHPTSVEIRDAEAR